MFRLATVLIFAFALAGCSRTGDGPGETIEKPASSDRRALTAGDLKLFLAIVRGHEGAVIPEFTPLDEDEALDFEAPAAELLASFRSQFKRLFDPERQGAIWQRDGEWSRALKASKTSPQRFAALVRDVSLAIMRVRLEARVDLDQLVAQARREVSRAERVMNQIDKVPPNQRTREAASLRTRSVQQLGRSVALLEFAELVRQVPPESGTVVRRFSRELKPLLPASVNDELLAELKELVSGGPGQVEPAVYETPQDE